MSAARDDVSPAAPMLSGRIRVADGGEYPCTVRVGTLDALTVVTRAPGRRDETAMCYLDGIGALGGRIGATEPDGFQLFPTVSDERRERIAARLAWHATRATWTTEQRADLRIVPEFRTVSVRFSDERVRQGRILDLSRTGAKIQLPHRAEGAAVGAPVTVGKRRASVVRVEDAVIAIRFRLPLGDETFNPSVQL